MRSNLPSQEGNSRHIDSHGLRLTLGASQKPEEGAFPEVTLDFDLKREPEETEGSSHHRKSFREDEVDGQLCQDGVVARR